MKKLFIAILSMMLLTGCGASTKNETAKEKTKQEDQTVLNQENNNQSIDENKNGSSTDESNTTSETDNTDKTANNEESNTTSKTEGNNKTSNTDQKQSTSKTESTNKTNNDKKSNTTSKNSSNKTSNTTQKKTTSTANKKNTTGKKTSTTKKEQKKSKTTSKKVTLKEGEYYKLLKKSTKAKYTSSNNCIKLLTDDGYKCAYANKAGTSTVTATLPNGDKHIWKITVPAKKYEMTKSEIVSYGKKCIEAEGFKYISNPDKEGLTGWNPVDVHKGESKSQIKYELKSMINVVLSDLNKEQFSVASIKIVEIDDYWEVRIIY